MTTAGKTPFKVEYAVEMTCNDCVEAVSNALAGIPGIDGFYVDLSEQRVVVEGTAPPSKVFQIIRNTGRKAVVRGQGTLKGKAGAAVCIFEGYTYTPASDDEPTPKRPPRGVARFIQIDEDICLIDVTVEGIPPGTHGIHIHETGDISDGVASTGDHYNPEGVAHGDLEQGHVGDLGNIIVDENGWGDLLVESRRIKVGDVIGRSMVITHDEDDLGQGSNEQSKIDGNSGRGALTGVIARSAGAFENSKKICACSGTTLWEDVRI
ncbi:6271_t:CDS:2 [Paraglomus occultum]|uniref:Superoxide dismutase 1 copper chaperone n=1 Tax=Paraglomus occultum TaxID=144539 RepID=A0A9N8W7U3_9GLOM|nr:6271_t:CDS:2 [Paraglomus occultum]